MRNLKYFFSLLFFFAFAFWPGDLWAAGIVIDPWRLSDQPVGLMKNGKLIRSPALQKMAAAGEDLSLLNPPEDNWWQNKKFSVSQPELNYPTPEVGVQFVSESLAQSRYYQSFFSAKVRSQNNPNEFYTMTGSLNIPGVLARSGLLNKMGYYHWAPKYFSSLRVQFADEAEKKIFLAHVLIYSSINLQQRKWLIKEEKTSVVFRSVLLEKGQQDFTSFYWGLFPEPKSVPPEYQASEYAKVNNFSPFRTFRGVLIPILLLDMDEKPNRFNPNLGTMDSGKIIFNYPVSTIFEKVKLSDAQWALRRVLQLTPADHEEIFKILPYDECYRKILLASYYRRILAMANLFGMKNEFKYELPSLEVTCEGVEKGRVVKNQNDLPFEMISTAPSSPQEGGYIWSLLGVEGKSALMASLAGKINEHLVLLATSDALKSEREALLKKLQDHIKNNPGKPFFQPVTPYFGLTASIAGSVSRHLSSGTFFQSQAPVQLVDQISLSGRLGYFVSWDGKKDWIPFLSANISLTRDYTHVRPLATVKQANETPLKDILIPSPMHELVRTLGSNEVRKMPAPKDKPEDPDKVSLIDPVDDFFNRFLPNEVFIVTDSAVKTLSVAMNSPLDVLLAFNPVSFISSLFVSADVSRIATQQTVLTRTSTGVQISFRPQNYTWAEGGGLDINYFVNLFRARAQAIQSDLLTYTIPITYTPGIPRTVNASEATDNQWNCEKNNEANCDQKRKIQGALFQLFQYNNAQQALDLFKDRVIKSRIKLDTVGLAGQAAVWKSNEVTESERLDFTFPKLRPLDENGKEYDLPLAQESVGISIFRKAKLIGRDLFSFSFDLLEGFLNYKNSDLKVSRLGVQNPVNSIYGSAEWNWLETQNILNADSHVIRGDFPKWIVNVQKNYGGWSLSAADFNKTIDQLQMSLVGIPGQDYELVQKSEFHLMTSLDFYRITLSVLMHQVAVDKIKQLVLAQTSQNFQEQLIDRSGVSGMIQSLSLMGSSYRPEDKVMMKSLISILGDGDGSKGRAVYDKVCLEEKIEDQRSRGGYSPYAVAWQRGIVYPCLAQWLKKLMSLSRSMPPDYTEAQARWAGEVFFILYEKIPLPLLLKFLGSNNYLVSIKISGFRRGDQGSQQDFMSKTYGTPLADYPDNFLNYFARMLGITPTEFYRTNTGVQ